MSNSDGDHWAPKTRSTKSTRFSSPPRHAAVGCGYAPEVGQDAVPAWTVEPAPDARENAPEPDDRDIDEGRFAEGVVHPGRVLTWDPRLQRRS